LIDKSEIKVLINKFKQQTMPDTELTEAILTRLKIYDIVELGFCMNRFQKNERDAALAMVEKYLPDLLSGDPKRFESAKNILAEIYYKVQLTDEEAWL